MRALVLEEFGGPLIMKEVPTPTIEPNEALVRVRNVGVCGTDLKIRAGRMGLNVLPLIMGHEVAVSWPRWAARCRASLLAIG